MTGIDTSPEAVEQVADNLTAMMRPLFDDTGAPQQMLAQARKTMLTLSAENAKLREAMIQAMIYLTHQ